MQPAAVPFPGASSKNNSPPCDDCHVQKRNLNTLAARRYRQKCTDETQTLAAELKKSQIERDSLEVHAARMEGKLEALRQMLRAKESHWLRLRPVRVEFNTKHSWTIAMTNWHEGYHDTRDPLSFISIKTTLFIN